jgi:hypothetical protein
MRIHPSCYRSPRRFVRNDAEFAAMRCRFVSAVFLFLSSMAILSAGGQSPKPTLAPSDSAFAGVGWLAQNLEHIARVPVHAEYDVPLTFVVAGSSRPQDRSTWTSDEVLLVEGLEVRQCHLRFRSTTVRGSSRLTYSDGRSEALPLPPGSAQERSFDLRFEDSSRVNVTEAESSYTFDWREVAKTPVWLVSVGSIHDAIAVRTPGDALQIAIALRHAIRDCGR